MSVSSKISDEEYNELVLRVGESAAALQKDDRLGQEVTSLLQDLDGMHREVLARILGVLEASAPAVLARLLRDPAVQSLLLIYDFIPQPSEMPDLRSPQAGFVPVEDLQIPVWIPVGKVEDFPANQISCHEINQRSLILIRFEERIVAFSNHCVGSILPLQLGRLEDDKLICPWHGCRYQLPGGQEEGGQRGLGSFPVQISPDQRVRIGFNIPESDLD